MTKLSEIAAVIEDHCEPYTLIEIRAGGNMILACIEYAGGEEISAQAKFAIGMVQLATAEDWHQLVQVQTRQSVADLDRFLSRDPAAA